METPRYEHAPIQMRMAGPPLEHPGDFYWMLEVDWRGRRIPDGCRVLIVALPSHSERGWLGSEWTVGYKNSSGAQWSWDDNKADPTLSPSLHLQGIWHGWVRAGELVEAE